MPQILGEISSWTALFEKKVNVIFRPVAKKVLLFLERNVLSLIGIFLGSKLLEQLTPYAVNGFKEKIRLGNLYDGGYVIPAKILKLADVVYSYGIDYHIDFEEDLIKRRNIPVRLYDHTVSGLPVENKSFFFKKQGIGKKAHGNFSTFKKHLEENGDTNKKIILKLDVEGAEWDVMDQIIKESSKNILAIILEVHRLYRYEKMLKYVKVFKKINSKFTLVHLHGNNNSGLFVFGRKKISSTLETTFINNDLLARKTILKHSLPSEIDYPNISDKKDIILDFWL